MHELMLNLPTIALLVRQIYVMTVDVACNYIYVRDASVCQCRQCCGGCVAMLHEG